MVEILFINKLKNKLISIVLNLFYLIKETLLLRINRYLYSRKYENLDNPLISVYIPTYNRAEILIERAIKSVLNQTYKNFELVIVGDCCTDNTENLVLNIQDDRIRFYNIPYRNYRYPESPENHWLAGPVVAANKALELIKGDWIARIDDDDIWTSDHLEKLLTTAQNDNLEFISANLIMEKEGKRIFANAVSPIDPYYTKKPIPENINIPSKIGGTQTWLYRSYLKFYKYNINCWRKSWNRVNDVDFSIRMYKSGVKMGFIEDVVAYVLPRPGENSVGYEAYIKADSFVMEKYKF